MATYGYGGFGYLGGTAAAAGLAAAPNYCKNVSAVPNRADSELELDWIEKPAPSQSVTECALRSPIDFFRSTEPRVPPSA
jgi:hypothetical protein